MACYKYTETLSVSFTYLPNTIAKFGGPNNSDLLCLQDEKISDLEFRVDWLGLNDIIYFSVRQSLHAFLQWVEGWYVRF